MFEFHGWVVISASPGETETEDEDDATAVEAVRKLVEGLDAPPGLIDLRVVNGQPQLHFGGLTNHLSQDVKDLLDTVGKIAQFAPGSYGVVYFRDDEDPGGRTNEFRVLVIARGRLSEQPDPFLSPVVPVVEDAAE